jgi:hypothetical protein
MASLLLAVVTGESSSAERLRLVVAAYLARYRGLTREHTASDLRAFLTWCGERGLDPLTAQRTHLELYVRWCQEVRRFKPSTVSRRTSAAQRSSLKRFLGRRHSSLAATAEQSLLHVTRGCHRPEKPLWVRGLNWRVSRGEMTRDGRLTSAEPRLMPTVATSSHAW